MKPTILLLSFALHAHAFDIAVTEQDHVDVSNGGKVVAKVIKSILA